MSAGMLNESTILISAKLDEQKTINTINSQLQKLKINPIECEVKVSKIEAEKCSQQIQNTVSKLRKATQASQYSIPLNFDVRHSDSNKIKTYINDFISRINKNIGTLQTVNIPIDTNTNQTTNLTAALTNGSRAIFNYKNNAEETTRVIVTLNEKTNQLEARVTSLGANYGRLASKQAKEQQEVEKYTAQAIQESKRAVEQKKQAYLEFDSTIQQVQTDIHTLGQKMMNLPMSSYSTESLNSAYKQTVADYEHVLELQRQLAQGKNLQYDNKTGSIIPPLALQEQESLLNQIQQALLRCTESYNLYGKEVQYANTKFKEQQADAANMQKQNQQMALLATNIQKAQVQVQALAKNWSAIKTNPELNAELQRLIASSKQLSTGSDLKQFNAELNTFKARCRAVGVATKSMGDSFKAAWKNFSFFFSASRLIYIVTNRTKELVTNVKNLNSAMIELRKVTDETENSYDRFLKKAKQNSKGVGMGLSEYVQATADFARLGYSVSESNELAKIAAMYKNVADDMDNIGTGTGTLISTMKAFNVEFDNAVSIVDKLNEVSNKYAVMSGNLGEGLGNSAASMSIAGNTLDETIALLTAGTEITQDGSGMGNALKVFSMRIRGMKGQLSELGEEVDENVESISKMQTQILNLTHGKVNIFDDNGNFKSPYEILQGIASVYKDLSSTEQADLLETIAGKHRGNAVAAILTNWSTAQGALATSLNSAGSAAKENEKYMQGLEGHLQQLQSTWESLSSTLVNDDFLIGTVSVGTDIISTVDGIASSIGGLNTVVAGVGLGIFIKNLKNIKSHVELTSKAFDASKNIVNQYGVTTELSGTAIMQYRTALEGLSASEQKAILTKIGLNQHQIETILGLNQQTTATTALTLSEMQQIATDKGLTSEQMNKIRQFTLGNLVIEGQTTETNELTQANIALIASTIGLTKEQQEYIIKALAVKNANENITKSTKGLGVSLGSFFKSKAGIFTIATTAITLIGSVWTALKQQQEEAYNKVIEKSEEATSHIQNVEQAWSRYLELGTNATEEEKRNALESVNEQLDNKIQKLQDATAAEKDYADAVKDSIKKDYAQTAVESNTAYLSAKQQIQNQWNSDYDRLIQQSTLGISQDPYVTGNEFAKEIIEPILGELGYYEDTFGGFTIHLGASVDTTDVESVIQYYEKLKQAKENVEQVTYVLSNKGNSKDKQKAEDILSSAYYKEIVNIINDNEDKINDYINQKRNTIYYSVLSQKGIPSTVSEFNEVRSAMLKQAGDSQLLADTINEQLISTFPELAKEAQNTAQVLSNTEFTIADSRLAEQIETYKTEIEDIPKTYQSLAAVVSDYNQNGYLTLENLESIISAGDEYIDTLFNEEGQLELNKDAYIKLAKAKLEDIRYSMLQSAISDINSLSKDAETKAVDDLTDSTHNLTEQTLALCAAKKIEEGVSPEVVYQYVETYSKYSTIIDNVSNSLDTATDNVFGFTEANERAKDALEKKKDALEQTKDALEKEKDNLEENVDALQNLVDLVTEYITKTKELEKDALEKQKETIDELIDKRKEELELLRDEIEANKTLAEKQNTVAQNALAASIAELDDSGAGRKAQKETSDALNESRSDLEDYLVEQSFDTRLEALDKLQETNEEFYDNQIKVIDKYLDDERRLYEDACSMIDNDNGELYGKLLKYVKTYTTQSESEFNYLWSSAKSAIDKYNDSNLSTLHLLDTMQGRVYVLSEQIDIYDDKISNISDAISSIGDNISTVAGGINANADALTNFNNKYKSLMSLLDGYNWTMEWKGVNYFSRKTNRDDAALDILSQIENQTGYYIGGNVYGGIKQIPKYAQGTRSAIGGLSITQENGYEFIPTSIGNGQYTLLDRGNPVFNATATRNLYDMANNPRDFLFDTLGNYSQHPASVISNTSVVSPTIKINIQGDATQSTVNALRHEAKNIIKQATENVMNIALRNKRLI